MRIKPWSGYRKYREAAYMNLKAQLAWRADVIFNMLFTISKILFAFLLWGIIFQQKEVVKSILKITSARHASWAFKFI